jgi:hypothetical protein
MFLIYIFCIFSFFCVGTQKWVTTKVQEPPPSIKVTRKLMVCESPSKGLVVQGKDASPPMHHTKCKLHCCLIIFLGRVSICGSHLWSKADLPSWGNLYLIRLNPNYFKVQILTSYSFFYFQYLKVYYTV